MIFKLSQKFSVHVDHVLGVFVPCGSTMCCWHSRWPCCLLRLKNHQQTIATCFKTL